MGKPIGSDEASGKLTCPALLGLEESYKLAEQEANLALNALEGFTGKEAQFLNALVLYVVNRTA